MRVGITGASGMIGTALGASLRADGHTVVGFVRRPAGPGEIRWDPDAGTLDAADLEGLDAVVHLAGAGIGDHRWTAAYKRSVMDSRRRGTSLVAEAVATAGVPTLISGSAIGYYPDSDELVDEQAPAGSGFLSDVVVAWEAATHAASAAGARVAHIRTGIVLSPKGGALPRMLPLFKLGLGGRFGNGRQWMSWIALDDEVGAIEHLLTASLAGPVNLTAPNPVPNGEFAAVLGRVLHRPAAVPVPKFGPRLVLGGELADSLLFASQRVEPVALLADGYRFQHPDLESALRAILAR